MPESKPPSFPSLVQRFFTEYLTAQRAVSLRTVACYRDGLTLFLSFAQRHLGKPATALALVDLTPELILAFLDDLETKRHNCVRSRNLRLTALRAFLNYAGRRDVSSLHVVEKALSVPMKRFDRPMLGYLTRKEMVAVLGRPDASWTSRRDHLLFTMLYNTGARVSEIIGVRVADVVLDRVSIVHLMGKGRKERSVPLWPSTAREIQSLAARESRFARSGAITPESRRARDDALQCRKAPLARRAPRHRSVSRAQEEAGFTAHHPPHHGDAPTPGPA